MTTKEEIGQWFDRGVEEGATHMLVVCDTYDWDDYPVYVKLGEDAREQAAKYPHDMQKLMEVYNLAIDRDQQLKQGRAFNY
jgi:hypothetical protein